MEKRSIVDRTSPLWLGVGITVFLLAVLIVIETALGRWDALAAEGELHALSQVSSGILRDIRIAVIHCLVVGYVAAALLHVIRNAKRTVRSLQDALDCTPEECRQLAESITLKPRVLAAVTAAGFATALATPYLVPPVPEQVWNPATWGPEVAWHRILGPLTLIGQLWLAYAIIKVSVRLSRIAGRLKQIDLLDPGKLAPFTRIGLTHALLLIGLLSIWSLMLIETGFAVIMTAILFANLAGVTLAVVAPAVGVHRRIRESKESELAWIHVDIREQRNVLRSSDSRADRGKLADLVAYRNLIDDVPEWPFTTSTYARIVAYAGIPLLAWGTGVVAEEIVGRILF